MSINAQTSINTSYPSYISSKAEKVLKKLKDLALFPATATKWIGKAIFQPDTHLILLEELTAKIQKKSVEGIKISTSDKILRVLTGKESKIYSHNEFMNKYLIKNDDITSNQKTLLEGLFKRFPEKAEQNNVMISKGGLLSKSIRNSTGAGGVVHLDEKNRDNRNIVVNGNYGKGSEQFFYVHETMHHIIDLARKSAGLEEKLSPLLEKINEEYKKSPGTYEKVRIQMINKYPQHGYYFHRMPFYGGTNSDEFIAESYSNPVFREYIKAIVLPNNKNILQSISDVLNSNFNTDCFK